MLNTAERLSEVKIWNLPLNLAALEVIGDFGKNSFSGTVGLRELH